MLAMSNPYESWDDPIRFRSLRASLYRRRASARRHRRVRLQRIAVGLRLVQLAEVGAILAVLHVFH